MTVKTDGAIARGVFCFLYTLKCYIHGSTYNGNAKSYPRLSEQLCQKPTIPVPS